MSRGVLASGYARTAILVPYANLNAFAVRMDLLAQDAVARWRPYAKNRGGQSRGMCEESGSEESALGDTARPHSVHTPDTPTG